MVQGDNVSIHRARCLQCPWMVYSLSSGTSAKLSNKDTCYTFSLSCKLSMLWLNDTRTLPFLFYRFHILDSSFWPVSLHFRASCRDGSTGGEEDILQEDLRKQAFNKMMHLCFVASFLSVVSSIWRLAQLYHKLCSYNPTPIVGICC